MAGRIITTGASILLIATGFAIASDIKFDHSVGEAAAKIAASKLGDIRGSIDHDATPFLVTRELLEKEDAGISLVPRPAWVSPKEDASALPPMVSTTLPDLDYTLTGSITRAAPSQDSRVYWDKFDSNGNPIE